MLSELNQPQASRRIRAPKAFNVLALLVALKSGAGWHTISVRHRHRGATNPSSNHAGSRSAVLMIQDAVAHQKLVDILRADMPNLLRREPTWDIVAEKSFKVIDKRGTGLEGLAPIKLLLKLFRNMREQFEVSDDISVDFATIDGFLAARWKVQLGSQKHSGFGKLNDKMLDPLDIEAETAFHLNENGQVDYMQIDSWRVNGQQFELFPEVQLSEDPADNFKKLRTWMKSIKTLQPGEAPDGDRRKVLIALLLSLSDDALALLCVGGGGAKGKNALTDLAQRKVIQTRRSRLRGRRMHSVRQLFNLPEEP